MLIVTLELTLGLSSSAATAASASVLKKAEGKSSHAEHGNGYAGVARGLYSRD